jgi:hypothetical protein
MLKKFNKNNIPTPNIPMPIINNPSKIKKVVANVVVEHSNSFFIMLSFNKNFFIK